MNELEYLTKQLDMIIGFLDVSTEEIYEIIKTHDTYKLGLTIDYFYERQYENYKNHITSSALILGFTHFEDYITKMIIRILIKYPEHNKIKFTIARLNEIGNDFKEVLSDEQAKKITFKEKINLIKKIYVDFDDTLISEVKFVNDLRNCLMHNNGLADKRLEPNYQVDDKIILTSNEVNGYGIKARNFAKLLWDKVQS